MKKIVLVAIMALVIAGCTSFGDLEEGNKLALENQTSLETNVLRQFDNFKKLGESTGKWDTEDEKTWLEQRGAVAEQLAVGRVWLIVIEEAIKNNSIDAKLLGSIIKDLPGWIQDGKDIYDLIKAKSQ